jgi:opacity protein-like surface antigen/outer membrane protease
MIGIAWLIATPAFGADPSVLPLPAYVRGSGGHVGTEPSYPVPETTGRWYPPSAPATSPIVKAPVPRAWSWTGFYLGAHVGGGLGTANFADPFGLSIYGDIVRTPAFFGGGQIGFNWQVPHSRWVLGVQADVSGLASEGTNTCFAYSGSAINATCRVRPEATSTVTGRFGYAFGPDARTLVYAKGGLAWADSHVDMAANLNLLDSNSSSLSIWGVTVGGGAEYALTPAWSLFAEYDYLGFGSRSVTNLGTATVSPLGAIIVPPGITPPGSSGVSQSLQEFKLGLNYKLGSEPLAPGLDMLPTRPFPDDPRDHWIPIPGLRPGWELEAGFRYMNSWGLFHKDLGQSVSSGLPTISNVSRLTYDDLQTDSGEFFARMDTPINFFIKGFVGGGWTGNGHMNDEDFGLPFQIGPSAYAYIPYSNTISDKVTGNTIYGVIDGGYDFLHGATYKVGAFAGYTAFHQTMSAYGCAQIANPNSDCAAFAFPLTTLGITESDMWQAMRVGINGETTLTDQFKVSVDAAYLPFVDFSGLDTHWQRVPILLSHEGSNGGQGVQLEALLSYYFTPTLSVGLGGRYWAAWTTSGTATFDGATVTQNLRGTFEQAGAFVQIANKFGVPAYYAAENTQ